MQITGRIVGAEAVTSSLAQAKVGYSERVRKEVRSLGLELLRKVKAEYLTGQALNRRTGRLHRSINERFQEDGSTYSSTVGTNVGYGRMWELGFNRKVGAGARGGPRTLQSAKAHARYLELHPPGTKHEDARPFLKPALAAMKDEIRTRLVTAISGGR